MDSIVLQAKGFLFWPESGNLSFHINQHPNVIIIIEYIGFLSQKTVHIAFPADSCFEQFL